MTKAPGFLDALVLILRHEHSVAVSVSDVIDFLTFVGGFEQFKKTLPGSRGSHGRHDEHSSVH